MLMDESRFLEPLLLAGKIIMENGGETYRVEETVTRMGHAFGLDTIESFAVPSGVFVSYRKADGTSECGLKRILRGGTNLTRVNAVNAVSREIEAGQLTCEETLARLNAIAVEKSPYRSFMPIVAAGVCSGGFSLMFQGGVVEFLMAAVFSALAQCLGMLLERNRMQALVATLLESLLVAFVPTLLHSLGMEFLLEAVVAGALMPLLPGLAMTNAVRDAMRGDIMSGMSHGMSALMTAALISGGTLAATAVLRVLMGGGL